MLEYVNELWMNTIENSRAVGIAWKTLLENGTLYYLLPFAAAVFIFILILFERIEYLRSKSKYSVKRSKKSLLEKFVSALQESRYLKTLLDFISIRLGMFTQNSMDSNNKAASLIMLAMVLISAAFFVIAIAGKLYIWYMAVLNFIILSVFLLLLFYIFSTSAKLSFTKKLPATYKLLNSRYLSKGDILSAIDASMDDFDKSVRKVMRTIYDILLTNNMRGIDNTFSYLERMYKLEHFSLLLNLIKQAYYKGGNEVIKAQFENSTEDILDEIENIKDLAATSRSFIMLSIVMPFMFEGVKMFNVHGIGDKARDFSGSPMALQLELLFYVLLIAYIGYMFYLERTS